jgi:hypothetical protein
MHSQLACQLGSVTYASNDALLFRERQLGVAMSSIHAPKLSSSAGRRIAPSQCPRGHRKGTVLILFAVLLAALLGVMAFAIDLGVTVHHRASLQNAADAAALAAADILERGPTAVNNNEVRTTAKQYFQLNRPGVTPNILLGRWDPVTRVFDPGIVSQLEVNAVSVSAQWQYPSLFGRVLGHASYQAEADAIAVGGRDIAGPRDIVLLIDQTSALLTPQPDEYAAGENAPDDYPLNAKRALKEAVDQFVQFLLANYPDDRIGISGFANDTALEAGLTADATMLQEVFDISRPNALVFSYQEYVDTAAGRYPGSPSRIGLALDGASEGQIGGRQIATGANSRSDAKKVLVLVSDGSTTTSPDPLSVAAQLAANSFHLHTITVGPPNALMRQLIVGDGRNYVVPTPATSPSVTYNDMLQAFNQAFDKISGKQPPPAMLVK